METGKGQIGKAVRDKRQEKGLTQVQLSQQSGVARSYIADIEKGRYAPSVKTLTKLARVLDLDLNFLLINDGNTSQR
ncbi:hypothetical protein P22_1999 [Propionispora sp. 2/2-37]|uniref:helix-turn-helix domain-containing protein n=1 Tax=Propionispora sp. 2/2-37 TaxID=1677858 RepID=UPI0006BB680A|nr:helix-turn-helix transcriptional regulator [Propionispora sp. 2/2-37]CUH95913.1 hypothetical protein P22_1999 [Propionispora sp. 2/2-37]